MESLEGLARPALKTVIEAHIHWNGACDQVPEATLPAQGFIIFETNGAGLCQ